MTTTITARVVIVGGGIVGTAVLHALSHRGVEAILLEADSGLAFGASGTNSGILHSGFDSTPGQLETELIIRAATIRPPILEALGVPVLHCGAELVPHRDEDAATIRLLAANAAANGVEVAIRAGDGALIVPGEGITDPVAFSQALAASAVGAGARVELNARVVQIDSNPGGLRVMLADGRQVEATLVINCAGLHADDIAQLVGDHSFQIYPRKGEFFVFELPGGATLDRIVLPVPTKRTKGVLVFPTLDGKVVAGPTAVDLLDKDDWTVRPQAYDEVIGKAIQQHPALSGLPPIASYAGLRPAGRNSNYVIGQSQACDRLVNVAAIRSTGLSASLGIAAYVADMLPALGVPTAEPVPPTPVRQAPSVTPWWRRTAQRRLSAGRTVEKLA